MKAIKNPSYRMGDTPWLGNIPSDWRLQRLKFVAQTEMGQSPSSTEYGASDERPFLQGNGEFGDRHPTARLFCDGAMKIAPRSSILLSVRAPVGELNQADREYGIGRGLCAVIPKAQQLSVRYAWYLLSVTRADLISRETGSTYGAVSVDEVRDMTLCLPNGDDQRAIADFLDRETGRIDMLSGKKRELIEKLKEKRTALISRTVTRGLPAEAAAKAGLNPHPKLKPSGIEWLGDLPKHWSLKRLRYVATRIQTGSTPPTAEEKYYEDGSVPWFGPGSFGDAIILTQPVKMLNVDAITDGAARLFRRGATMVVTIGATIGKVSSINKDASCNQQITVIEIKRRDVHPRFITYQLKRLEPTRRAIAPSATLPILAQGEIAGLPVAIPRTEEQAAITDYLDGETAKIDKMMEKVEAAIEKLQEYRTALITAAVTGKIDVRAVDR